ncbi:MAG: hypothetical protein PHY92_05085 [Alphaproteobacteria bacterium]|nr:hypothetical protein [Alphaproteobacteria bacterium]
MRFWLSRLHDPHFQRSPDGKKYDPFAFRDILRARQKLAVAF